MAPVLVTGVTGFVGAHLAARLVELGREVRVLVRDPARLPDAGWVEHVEVVRGDATDAASLERALDGVAVAHYLLHAMSDGDDYAAADREMAQTFAAAAERAGADWRLVYGGRQRTSMAFTAELAGYGGEQVDLRTDDGVGPIDVARLVQQSEGAKVFACGPLGLLDALEAAFDTAGRSDDLHLERFSAAAKPLPGDGTFRVNLARTGGHVDVPPGQSVLEALRAAGVDAPCSCEQGFCGTCETRVLAGEPDHRDDLLTEAERARGDVMMPCVSRSKTPELTLDL